MLLIGAITLAPLALLPPMLQHLHGYSVIDTGMVLAPRGAGVLITMFISSQFAGKIDLRFVIATGMLLISYSLCEMAQDRKSKRLNSSHKCASRMQSSDLQTK